MAFTLSHNLATAPLSPLNSIVGRERDVLRLRQLLAEPDTRLVTLLGAGGAGKTRLAQDILRDLSLDIGDRCVFVALAETVMGGTLPAIARTLSVNLGEAEITVAAIASAIGDDSILMVLDNAEQVVPDLAFLPQLLTVCRGLKVLVTSRLVLRLSMERVFPVEPLATEPMERQAISPASQLFVERASAVRPSFELNAQNRAEIDAICRQLDGLPLAIELAAARSRVLVPSVLRARLGARLGLLTGGPRDAPARHQTLRATIAWSHDLLNAEERSLFRRLAVFAHSAPYEAIETVCAEAGNLDTPVDDLITSLSDHSLIHIEEGASTGPRIHMLDTIREFARENLAASGDEAKTRTAHAHWFASLVTSVPEPDWRAGTDQLRSWSSRHLPDARNLSIALGRLVEVNEFGLAVAMAGALVPFWLELGELSECARWVEALLPELDKASPLEQAVFHRMASVMALKDGHDERARAHANSYLNLANQAGNLQLASSAMNLLAQIHWNMGAAAEGERLQREAIAARRALGDDLGAAIIGSQLAEFLVASNALDEAAELINPALPIIERHRPQALPLMLGTAGYLALKRGELDRAAEALEQSLAYHREPPHWLPSVLAGRLLVIAELAHRRGFAVDAARLAAAAANLCERIQLSLSDWDMAVVAEIEHVARESLGVEEASRASAEGMAMSVSEAIDLALQITALRDQEPRNQRPEVSIGLTAREQDVLAQLVSGRSNAEIAGALFIAERTVTTHLSRLYAKLNVTTRSEAIAAAHRLGLASSTGT